MRIYVYIYIYICVLPSAQEMLEYVKGLDIDPIKEADMLWIAEEACRPRFFSVFTTSLVCVDVVECGRQSLELGACTKILTCWTEEHHSDEINQATRNA